MESKAKRVNSVWGIFEIHHLHVLNATPTIFVLLFVDKVWLHFLKTTLFYTNVVTTSFELQEQICPNNHLEKIRTKLNDIRLQMRHTHQVFYKDYQQSKC